MDHSLRFPAIPCDFHRFPKSKRCFKIHQWTRRDFQRMISHRHMRLSGCINAPKSRHASHLGYEIQILQLRFLESYVCPMVPEMIVAWHGAARWCKVPGHELEAAGPWQRCHRFRWEIGATFGVASSQDLRNARRVLRAPRSVMPKEAASGFAAQKSTWLWCGATILLVRFTWGMDGNVAGMLDGT